MSSIKFPLANPLWKGDSRIFDDYEKIKRLERSLAFAIVFFLIFKSTVIAPLAYITLHVLHRRWWQTKNEAGLVLWLRRFNIRDLHSYPFASVLQYACHRCACPITVQDSMFSISMLRRMGDPIQGLALILVYFFSFLLGFLGSGAVFTIVFRFYALCLALIGAVLRSLGSSTDLHIKTSEQVIENAPTWFMALHLLLVLWSTITAASFLYKHLCSFLFTQRLDRTNYFKWISDLASKAKRGKGTSRITVARLHDSSWQDVVRELVKKADAVLIDITDLGTGTTWELRVIRALDFPPEKLILACVLTNDDIPRTDIERVAEILGFAYYSKCLHYAYRLPARKKLVPKWLHHILSNTPQVLVRQRAQDIFLLSQLIRLATKVNE